MNHTPGPWAVSPTKHRTLIVSTEGFQVAALDEVSLEDAALIAAAPELLAALKHALERFECIPDHRDELGVYRNAADRARAAIVRATP